MDKQSIIKALRDTAQSASNAIASNVSGPVDLLAAGLRGVGLPIPQNAMGGSQWMAEKGLTRDVEMGAPRIVGETLGMAGPAIGFAKAPQIAAGMNQMVDNVMAPATLNKQRGVIGFDTDIDSFIQSAQKGRRIRTDNSKYASESLAQSPYDMGVINNYPEKDIQGFYLRRNGYDAIKDQSQKRQAASEAYESYIKDKKKSTVIKEAGDFDISRYF